MRRRDFVTVLGGAAVAWSRAAQGQQSATPVVGYLSVQPIAERRRYIETFLQGLAAHGFVEGQNLTIEYRAAGGRPELLPDLAAELVRRNVAVIAASGGPPAALAAKRATASIPIVFVSGGDPMQLGLVSSINRPSGNLTGIFLQLTELIEKRLALMHELLPKAKRIAILVRPANSAETEPTIRNATATSSRLGLDIQVFTANTVAEIDAAFGLMTVFKPDALFVAPDPFFSTQAGHFVALAESRGLPAFHFARAFVEAGGLMSYGPDVSDQTQLGDYAGRILKGEKPGDLPVVQPTKYEMVMNLNTAKSLGLDIPPNLLARADQVIE